MKKIFLFLFVLFCFTANAQWKYANFPFGGNATHIVGIANTNKVVANVSGNVFASADNGLNWTYAGNGLPPRVNCLATLGNAFYAGADHGLFLTTNNGALWAANTFFPDTVSVTALISNGTTLYVGTAAHGIYFSNNAGTDWAHIYNGLPADAYITSFLLRDTILFATSLQGIYRSSNGSNWKKVSAEQDIMGIAGTNKTLFANGLYDAYVSFNNGDSWSTLITNLPLTLAFGAEDSLIFAGTAIGVFVSKDQGNSWLQADAGLPSQSYVNTFGTGTNGLFAGTSKGVFSSADHGNNWVNKSTGLSSVPVRALHANGPLVFAGTLTGIQVSTDEGKTWNSKNKGFAIEPSITNLEKNDTGIYAGTSEGVFISLDQGENWKNINNNLPPGSLSITALAVERSNIYVGKTFERIFWSKDNGNHWEAANNGLPSNKYFVTIAANALTVFAGTYSGEIFVSINRGDSWLARNNGLEAGLRIHTIELVGRVAYAGTSKGLYRSADEGANWTKVINGIPADTPVRSLKTFGTSILAGGNSSVWITEDKGVSWRSISDGLPSTDVNALSLIGNTVFAGTEQRGVWSRPLIEIITSISLPKNENAFLIYPNPGNGIFTLQATHKDVQLDVINVVGERVAHMYLNTTTSHFDLSHLAKGMYMVNVINKDGASSTQKLMIQ